MQELDIFIKLGQNHSCPKKMNVAMTKVLVLHGPNLNLLGHRSPETYGHETLQQIDQRLMQHAETLGLQIDIQQRNGEGELIELIHQALRNGTSYIIINPAAYTHTSIALRDALDAVQIPFIEVHISNIHTRETFRCHSYCAELAQGVITGFGGNGYILALQAIAILLT